MIQTKPKSSFLVAWIIWASFLSGLAILLLLVYFLQDRLGAAIQVEIPIVWLRTVGYVLAIILFPIIGGIKRGLDRKLINNPDSASSGNQLAGLIVALALSESIGIFGFILFLLGDDLQTLYIFIGLAALAMLLHRPKTDLLN